MEAVPRLPMISFHLKVSPEPTTFGPKLKQYIRDFYNEDPESYNNEIHQLESLRSMAVRPPIDVAGCLLLKKYYCQLHFLQSRFPMGKDGAAAVTFTWRDTYANMVCSLANIRFEIISILYNIGAIHTQLGARTERTSAEGMKVACAHFQCAAWAFEHLKNSFPQPSGVDLAPELMTFMHQLCLAQAQECILEKSMLDNRKPTIVAKVAKQIVDYFGLALNTLDIGGSEEGTVSDTVGTKIYKIWKRYVKFKKAYHLAVTYLYQGLAAEEQRKMGERVTFYNAALASLNEAHSIYASAKGSVGITGAADEKVAIDEALTFTNDVIEGKRKAAKNENEFIYHEEVPEKDTLPVIKGASLVKGISFSINDPEVSGTDIFARLVPMKVHEANSLYSEEKAKILRSVGAKIEERDQHLNTYLTSLKLDHLSLWDPDVQVTEWQRLTIPDELVERCAALNAKPNIIQELVDIMTKLSDTSQDVERILKEMKKLLLEEEKKEKEYQDMVGKRPPSIVATDLTREAKKYEEAHNKALESNQALHKAITMHVKNLKILAQPLADLINHIPSPSTYLSEREKAHGSLEADKVHTKELKRILNKVDEMRRQRSDLHGKLRDAIAQDDLTRILVTATSESGPLDRLFADQLSKHQTLVNLIEQNLSAQDNILSALTDAYAQTADTRKGIEDIMKRRELTISCLIQSYDAYEDLLAKSSKGLEFYRKLEINVSKLLQRVKSTCKVQDEEREQILAQDSKVASDKMEPAVPSTYERTTNASGLKLKDYLNSRTAENVSGYQNQYYSPYKNAQGLSQTDSYAKPFSTDVVQSNQIQPSSNVPTATLSTTQSMETAYPYYSTAYTDYRTDSTYAHGIQNYSERPNATLKYSVPATNIHSNNPYPQAATNISQTMDYANTNHIPNAQSSQTSTVPSGNQDKFLATSQPSYNQNAVHYDKYPPVGYTNVYGGATEHNYGNINQYTDPSRQIEGTSKMNNSESTMHVQPNSLTSVPMSGIPVDLQGQKQHSYVQPSVQSVPSNLQTSTYDPNYSAMNMIPDQNVLPAQSNVPLQNYPVAQNENVYTKNYQSTTYSNPSEGQQYLQQSEQMSGSKEISIGMNPQATQSITPATVAVTVSNAASSYLTNVPSSSPVQYVHQPYGDQSQGQVGQPGQVEQHGQVGQVGQIGQLPYSSSYLGYQYDNTGQTYQQSNMMGGNTGQSYVYPPSTEIIQSHAKSTGMHKYSQNYQYPQNQYSQQYHYPQNYSHGGASYTYVQGESAVTTEAYKSQTTYPYGQSNMYSANAQGVIGQRSSDTTVNSQANYRYSPSHQTVPQTQATGTGGNSQQVNAYPYSPNHQVSQASETSAIMQQTNQAYVYGPNTQNLQSGQSHMSTANIATPQGNVNQVYAYGTNQQNMSGQTPAAGAIMSQGMAQPTSTYQQQESNAHYTSANINATLSQTQSSQYPAQSYETPGSNDTYYSTPYGLQMQNQGSTTKTDYPANYNQTYMQAVNNGTNTTTSSDTIKLTTKSSEPKSNVDLLSDLDITINHAPLVPEVRPLNKTQQEEEPVTNELTENEKPDNKDDVASLVLSSDDKNENLQIVWDTWYNDVQPKKDPLGDPTTLQKFLSDVEKYEKFVDSLPVKTLSGATNLDIKWKEIQGFEEREHGKQSSNIALAHASENRVVDCVPYDNTRVQLSSSHSGSSYINASHVSEITQWIPTAFIVSQAPMRDKLEEFWMMIWEQESEVIACLLSDLQLNNEVYWPKTKENSLEVGDFKISLQKTVQHSTYIQRVFSVQRSQHKTEKTVVHMQFLVWPSSGFPSSPGALLAFATDVMTEQALRRCSPKPVVVHCLDGGSLSSLFLVAAATVCHIRAGCGILDVPLVFKSLIKCRKQTVNKDSLAFAYRMVLYHAQDILMKRGILSSTRSTFDDFERIKGNKEKALRKMHCHPSDDFLQSLGVNVQRSNSNQAGPQTSAINSTATSSTLSQDKPNGGAIDPLSQLDPLWSIRR